MPISMHTYVARPPGPLICVGVLAPVAAFFIGRLGDIGMVSMAPESGASLANLGVVSMFLASVFW